ncbi:MAG TPA: hypothetical protein VHG92_04235 [Afifellaceae bacterium]|nr:hypothetical protein [Afifellaceae bacterium]
MAWRGYHDSASFRANNERALEMLIHHQAKSLLCDAREFLLIGGIDQEWLVAAWLPRAVAAGLQTCAMVTPLFHFNRVAVGSVVERANTLGIRIEYFDGPGFARRWLRSTNPA